MALNEDGEGEEFKEEGDRRDPPKREHPLYKQIAVVCGTVNAMTDSRRREELKQLCLCNRGCPEVILKRLKTHLRTKLIRADVTAPAELAAQVDTNPMALKYLCILDFEATCEEVNPSDYIHEIIEFPVVLLNLQTLKIEAEFHSYCRPWLHPILSKFCTSLTGITQSQVNTAPLFTDVLAKFNRWLDERDLGSIHKFAIVTDCPWDVRDCLFPQCALVNVVFPKYMIRWIDMRKMFGSFYQTAPGNLATMLRNLDMEFEGREHCGRDDAMNIARVMIRMVEDGCALRYNRALPQQTVVRYGNGSGRR